MEKIELNAEEQAFGSVTKTWLEVSTTSNVADSTADSSSFWYTRGQAVGGISGMWLSTTGKTWADVQASCFSLAQHWLSQAFGKRTMEGLSLSLKVTENK